MKHKERIAGQQVTFENSFKNFSFAAKFISNCRAISLYLHPHLLAYSNARTPLLNRITER
jgi:hypothetical protein